MKIVSELCDFSLDLHPSFLLRFDLQEIDELTELELVNSFDEVLADQGLPELSVERIVLQRVASGKEGL